jgi:hypothetical protein
MRGSATKVSPQHSQEPSAAAGSSSVCRLHATAYRASCSTDDRHIRVGKPTLPFIAGAQGWLAIETGGCCVGKGGCGFVACPTIGGTPSQVDLTAIAWVLITVAKPAGT